jgi:F0F1-type ATP synthase assembly protein I
MTEGEERARPADTPAEPADTPDAQPESDPPAHGALQPRGQDVAWSALGSLLAGPIVWGGVGYLLDRALGTGRVLTAIGVVVGSMAAFYIVYVRFGREDG